jgi:REP element-mobilizing transposase RayT
MIEYIGGIIRRLDGQLLAGGGMPDHVHLAAIVPPTVSLAEFVKKIKANSSRWIRQTFAQLQAFSWQDGYAAFAVSQSWHAGWWDTFAIRHCTTASARLARNWPCF